MMAKLCAVKLKKFDTKTWISFFFSFCLLEPSFSSRSFLLRMKKTIFLLVLFGLLVGQTTCLGLKDLFGGGEKEAGEDEFKCVSSGKIIPKSFLNDDFCDCLEDGSDEPLTSACSNGKFECDAHDPNLHQSLHSSRVNDGICDCCDGSDETRQDIIVCENTCDAKMKRLFAEKIEQMERYEAGKAIRDEWVKQGQEAKQNRVNEIKKIEEELIVEEGILAGLEEEREREEEEENKQKEEKRDQLTEQFKEALKLNTLGVPELEDAIVEVVAKKSAVTEALVECFQANEVEVDDVTALSSSIAISEGFSFEELVEKEDELRDTRNDLDRLKRRETSHLKRRERAEEKVKEAEKALEVEREKEKEKERQEKGEKKEEDGERMKRIWDRLRKLKKRSLKKEAEGFVEEEDNDNQFNNPNENLGTITDSAVSSALKYLDDCKKELEEALSEWENQIEQKEMKERVLDELEEEVERLQQEEEQLLKGWEEEQYGDFKKALNLGNVNENVLRICLWEGVKKGEGSRDLLRFLAKYGVEEPSGLTAPDEYLHFSRPTAEDARSKAHTASDKVDTLKNKIKELEDESEMDFGEEEEFYALKGHCFDTRADKYKYEFCAFEKANQDHTPLGNFDEESWKNDKTQMKFLKGRWCMDKDRAATVFFECGSQNEVIKVSEPERCEYHFFFRTPAACTAPPS